VNHYIRVSIAVGVLGAIAYGEIYGESHPHAQFIAVSPTNNLVASGGFVSNVSASTETYIHQPSAVVLEQFVPCDRLVIQASVLTPPADNLVHSVPATGKSPFFQGRERAPHLQIAVPKVPQFWSASFQKFRPRMVTRNRV
jgi:hypothetical protein